MRVLGRSLTADSRELTPIKFAGPRGKIVDSTDDFDEIFYRRRERHSEASMEPDLAHYVIRYYGHFMTETESLAHRHLSDDMQSP